MTPPYQIFITQDGSPTLVWPTQYPEQNSEQNSEQNQERMSEQRSEKMHHSDGALSESFYIYHEALRETMARGLPPRILSLGLGLGYNELIALGVMLKSQTLDFKIWSFEASDFLRVHFREWLQEKETQGSLAETYDLILTGVAQRLKINTNELKIFAREALDQKTFELRKAFPQDAASTENCTCVFYDAFSKKMNPELWLEHSLYEDLKKVLAPNAVLATYARTGSLNRALTRLGFRLMTKKGFSGKRESTMAIREEFR